MAALCEIFIEVLIAILLPRLGVCLGDGSFSILTPPSTAAPSPLQQPISVQKSEEEWRTILNPEQFRIIRQKGTELPGTGEYNKLFEEGVYKCTACGAPLYNSTTKFDSGCGWPTFFEALPGAVTSSLDTDGTRAEITCTVCGGHLGHVFKGEGYATPTDERHCVNSVSVKFIPA